MGEKEIKLILEILDRGHDVKIRKRPKTGEILIIEIKEHIVNGK